LAVPHQEQKVCVVTSPVTSDVCVHESGVDSLAPAELRVYPRPLALRSGAHDIEGSGVAPVREAVEVHAVAMVDVVVDCSMVAKVVGPQTVKAPPRNIQLVAPVAAAYAATWSADDDDAVVVYVEVERVVTAVVVLRVQTQG
jgi:hypothetical protein